MAVRTAVMRDPQQHEVITKRGVCGFGPAFAKMVRDLRGPAGKEMARASRGGTQDKLGV